MQYKNFKLIVFCSVLSLLSHAHAFLSTSEIIVKLGQYNLFDDSQLGEMGEIEKNEYGYPAWAATFSIVQNSDLASEDQVDAYAYLIALGIAQTNERDSALNAMIDYWLKQIKHLETEGCSPRNLSINDMESEFKARSNPSSPATSGENPPRD